MDRFPQSWTCPTSDSQWSHKPHTGMGTVGKERARGLSIEHNDKMRGRVAVAVTAALDLGLASCGGPNNALPPGSKAVTYHSVSIGVPSSWPEFPRSLRYACSLAGPGVLVGPPVLDTSFVCRHQAPLNATVVEFGSGPIYTYPPEVRRSLHGVLAVISSVTVSTAAGPIPEPNPYGCLTIVRFPGRNVWLRIREPSTSPETACDQANRIVAMIHPA